MKALLDTNILIDFLNGREQARKELDRHADRAISIITWMEVMVGAEDAVADATRRFLEGFTVIALDSEIAAHAVTLRRRHGVKLPDAIVWASADAHSMLLVTRNTKDFPADAPGIRVPYRL